MQLKWLKPVFCFSALVLVSVGCGIMPDLGKETMSSGEKAILNLQMGVRYMDMGMLDVAQEKLENAYDLDSRNPEILNALGVFYERIKEDDKAEDFYQSAISKDAENYNITNNYGRFLCEHGKFDKGLGLLRTSLDSPMNKRPWMELSNIGICYVQQNDAVQAEDFFRRALQINPEHPTALLEMQKISYNKQQYMSARAFLERYLSVAKHTPETLWFGFQTERALGNQPSAENYKELLLTTFPTSPEALQVNSVISK